MKQSLWALLVVAMLLVSIIGGALPSYAAPPLPDYRPMDIGPRIREWEPTPDRIKPPAPDLFSGAQAAAATASDSCGDVLDKKYFLYLDDYLGYYDWAEFNLVAQGTAAQIWVQADLSWPVGDPRPTPVITCDQVAYMLEQFEQSILPTETSFFGPPDFHDGSQSLLEAWGYFPTGYYGDEDGRQIIPIANVRDDNYYDPNYPLYIAGFYAPDFEAFFDRNTMTIDAYDWANRTGPDAARPYLYEGVFAHEYQHLLHADYDPDEENWINEGLSDWAEGLCGYGIPEGHVSDLAEMPENSLVAWGDQGDLEILADYGIAYMYQEYMYERYGQQFIQSEFRDASQGIASVDGVLAGLGATETFADTYHGFSVALHTKGAFTLEELSAFQVNVGHPGKRNPEAYATPGAPAWGTDYYLLWGYEQIANLLFNGYAFNPLTWTSDGDVLHGGSGDLLDSWAIFEASGGGTLTFDTAYVIEEGWDFGFVQVSTDGGGTWTSLANAHTTSDHAADAHPKVVANLPGLTGDSGGWVTVSFDLSPYAGQDILIAFRYVTDWSDVKPGWHIDNVYVDGTLISDGSSTAAFKSLNEVLGITNDYTVTLIGERVRKGRPEYEVMTLMSGGYISDWTSIRQMFDNYQQLVMLVTYDAEQGIGSYADYTLEVDHRGGVRLRK